MGLGVTDTMKAWIVRGVRRLGTIDMWVALFVVIVGGTLGWLSVARYQAYNAGMLDLGNMSQAIWSATQGRPLECTYGDGPLSRLSLHVELIYFLFAPIYALFSSPVTLVILQAGMFAAGGFPLYALAQRRLRHKWAARLIVLTFLLYPVAQTAVLFDFHGDTLAMPLLLFAFEALDRKAYKTYGLWLALALSCKFYVAVPVIVFGLVLHRTGRHRVGALTSATGAIWLLVAMTLIRPAFAPSGYAPPEATLSGYLYTYFGRALAMAENPVEIAARLMVATVVLVPSLWLGRLAPEWLMPAAAIVLPAVMASGLVSAVDYRYHHYAIAVPFLALACLKGAERLRHRGRISWVRDAGMQVAIVVVFSALLVDTPLNPLFWTSPSGWGHDSLAYGVTSRDELKSAWLAMNVPDRAPIVASFFLAPHLTNRFDVFLPQVRAEGGYDQYEVRFGRRLDATDVVVLDALFDYYIVPEVSQDGGSGVPFLTRSTIGPGQEPPVIGGVLHDRGAIEQVMKRKDFYLESAEDGLLLFSRQGEEPAIGLLQGVFTSELAQPAELQAQFSDAIGLVRADVTSLGGRRYRFEFEWVALRSLAADPPYIAVSRLAGVPDARIVHLPTDVLYPTCDWSGDSLVHEAFGVMIPDEVPPGTYPLLVGWYDTSDPYASFTDQRSALGKEADVSILTID